MLSRRPLRRQDRLLSENRTRKRRPPRPLLRKQARQPEPKQRLRPLRNPVRRKKLQPKLRQRPASRRPRKRRHHLPRNRARKRQLKLLRRPALLRWQPPRRPLNLRFKERQVRRVRNLRW